MTYLNERGRNAPKPLEYLLWSTLGDDASYLIADLSRETADALRRVPRSAIPDMPDRIIVATALQLGLPLLSRDAAITRAGVVQTIW